ncbi:hypothetical protein IH601_03515, partial [Candidatus Bipolaricaulota bacterium]|nr:hypothetical protein [Candidatus Bipolaricaulota bacterium]
SIQAEVGSLADDAGELETVTLTFFEDSKPSIAVEGDRMVRTSAGSTLTGAVRIEQAEAMSLSTESIFWDERNSVLESGPVGFVMDRIRLEAGAFHHDLNTNLSTLTRGIEAQVTQDDTLYAVVSDSAEVTRERVTLYGNVSIDEGSNQYRCQRLESDASAESVLLLGEVTGVWNQSTFSASEVELDVTGIRMRGDVVLDLGVEQMDEPHDA